MIALRNVIDDRAVHHFGCGAIHIDTRAVGRVSAIAPGVNGVAVDQAVGDGTVAGHGNRAALGLVAILDVAEERAGVECSPAHPDATRLASVHCVHVLHNCAVPYQAGGHIHSSAVGDGRAVGDRQTVQHGARGRDAEAARGGAAIDDRVGGAIEALDGHRGRHGNLRGNRIGPVRYQDQLARGGVRDPIADCSVSVAPTRSAIRIQAIGGHIHGSVGDGHGRVARCADGVGARRERQDNRLGGFLHAVDERGNSDCGVGGAHRHIHATGQGQIVHAIRGCSCDRVVDRQRNIGGPVRPINGERPRDRTGLRGVRRCGLDRQATRDEGLRGARPHFALGVGCIVTVVVERVGREAGDTQR